jgi:hypothetical protein
MVETVEDVVKNRASGMQAVEFPGRLVADAGADPGPRRRPHAKLAGIAHHIQAYQGHRPTPGHPAPAAARQGLRPLSGGDRRPPLSSGMGQRPPRRPPPKAGRGSMPAALRARGGLCGDHASAATSRSRLKRGRVTSGDAPLGQCLFDAVPARMAPNQPRTKTFARKTRNSRTLT